MINKKSKIASVNFGDGECDAKATVTIGNFTREIDVLQWLAGTK